jgi:hypothetical protein
MGVGRYWALGLTAPAQRTMPFIDTKLRKTLLVMLRASIDGEAMNARDAVLRIAKEAGYGPHELTDALVAAVQSAPKQARSGHEEMSHREAAAYCWDWFEAGGRLSEKEQKSVQDMMGGASQRRNNSSGSKIFLGAPQQAEGRGER